MRLRLGEPAVASSMHCVHKLIQKETNKEASGLLVVGNLYL